MVFIHNGRRMVYANPMCVATMEYTAEELTAEGFDFFTLATPETRDLARMNAARRLRGEVLGSQEYTLVTRAGRRIDVVMNASRIIYDNQSALMVVVTDITEVKAKTQRLVESEEKFRTFAEKSPNIVFVHADEGNVYVNDRVVDILGYTVEELQSHGFDIFSTIAPEYREAAKRNMARRMKGEPLPPAEYVFLAKDGKRVPALVNATAITHAGRPAILGVITEITEMKAALRALEESEEKFRVLAEQSLMAVGVLQDGVFGYVNQAFCNLVGYSREELSTLPAPVFKILIHPEDLEMVRSEHRKKENNDPTARAQYAYRGICKDGRVIWVEQYSRNVTYLGQAARLFTLVDITQRKEAEEQLRESESRFRLIFHDTPVSLWVEDASAVEARLAELRDQGGADLRAHLSQHPGEVSVLLSLLKILDLNPATLRMFEARNPEELVANLDKTMTPEGLEVFTRFLLALGEGKCEASAETLLMTLKGTPLFVDVRWVRTGPPGQGRIFLSMTDITRRKMLEQETVRTQNLESLGILAGGIAHDFNNLHTALFGNIELARLHSDPEGRASRHLDEALRASERAQRLTSQLLTFARGGSPLRETVRIEEVASSAAQFALSGSSVVCRPDFPENLWPVTVDCGQMDQVFSNLALNAREAMPQGGTVTLKGENVVFRDTRSATLKPGRYVKVTVEDGGTGIPPEYISRIFDPYFTTKGLGERKGTGLGLSICYSVVTRHGGHITVRSQLGRGTSFEVYLPAAEGETEPRSSTLGTESGSGPFKGSVLVMDDEEAVQNVAEGMLSHLGFQVLLTAHGEEALARFTEARDAGRPYDLLVLDLTVKGGMGGRETMEQLRRMDPAVKAIVASGYVDDPVMAAYREHGFAAAMVKPYTLQTLTEALRASGFDTLPHC